MQLLPIKDLKIEDRQRKEFKPEHINNLKASILSKGLLHPIVLVQRETGMHLVAGECRTRAISELHTDGQIFNHNGQPVEHGKIPYTLLGDLSPADIAEAELEENLVRANLQWQEAAEARDLIHKMRQIRDPAVTVISTAREIATLSGDPGTKAVQAENQNLVKSIAVAPHLSDPKVKAAKSLHEAFRIVTDAQANRLRAKLHELDLVKTEHTLIQGDCLVEMKKLPSGSIDVILADPPYGMNADTMKKSAHHHYDDSPERGLAIQQAIISEGFRLLKPRGIIFLFTDMDHFITIREHAKRLAFSPFRTPIIWRKGEDGFAPWGRLGFRRTYEVLLFLSKGEKGLKTSSPDIIEFKRPARNERSHAAEKPVDLLAHLLSLCTEPGDTVLDPTCGSGPIFSAASRAKVKATGIELDPDYHAMAAARLAEHEGAQEIEEEYEDEEDDLLS